MSKLHTSSSFATHTCLHRLRNGSALPTLGDFGAYWFAFATTCWIACLPNGDFYFRAFDGSVALPVAGYDYGGNWTISTGGTPTRWIGSSRRCTRSSPRIPRQPPPACPRRRRSWCQRPMANTLSWRVDRDRLLVADGTGLLALCIGAMRGRPEVRLKLGSIWTRMPLTRSRLPGFPADRIVVWGHSLGTGVAECSVG